MCACLSVRMYIYVCIFIIFFALSFTTIWQVLACRNTHSIKISKTDHGKRFYDKNYSFIVFQKVVDSWASSNPASKSHILSPNTSIVTKNLIVQRFVHFVLFLIKLHEQLLTFLPNFRQATAKDGIVFVYILCLSIVIRSY